jgi:hypothetical protein
VLDLFQCEHCLSTSKSGQSSGVGSAQPTEDYNDIIKSDR